MAETCLPRTRWMEQHSSQISTPRLREAQVGSENAVQIHFLFLKPNSGANHNSPEAEQSAQTWFDVEKVDPTARLPIVFIVMPSNLRLQITSFLILFKDHHDHKRQKGDEDREEKVER